MTIDNLGETSQRKLRKKNIQTIVESNSDDGDFIPSEDEYVPFSGDDSSSSHQCEDKESKRKRNQKTNRPGVSAKTPKKSRRQGEKIPWTPRSSKYMESKFNWHIYASKNTLPGKQQLEEAQNAKNAPSPLKRRPWRQLKDFIRNRAKQHKKRIREIGFNDDT